MTTAAELEQLLLPLVILHQQGQSLVLESSRVVGCRLQSSADDDHTGNQVVDAASLWPQPIRPQTGRWQLLTLKGRQDYWQLRFQGEVELTELPAPCLYPLPVLMEARKTWPAVKALVAYQQQLLVLLDALKLEDQAFRAV